jgi:hypothetical protein
MKKCLFILALALTCLLAGCATDFYQPLGVTNNPIGSKVGTALNTEGGILEAARRAGITRIATVDVKITNNAIITYIVSGE